MDIGIIGGADGPTALLVSSSPSGLIWLAGTAVVIGLAVWRICRKK